MTTATRPAFTVAEPTNEGTYYQRFGWRCHTPDGVTVCSGDERTVRAYARAMNRRLAREADMQQRYGWTG